MKPTKVKTKTAGEVLVTEDMYNISDRIPPFEVRFLAVLNEEHPLIKGLISLKEEVRKKLTREEKKWRFGRCAFGLILLDSNIKQYRKELDSYQQDLNTIKNTCNDRLVKPKYRGRHG